MLIPAESLPYFEKMIYIPMVITVLEQDRATVENSNFKLHRPYIALIERVAVSQVEIYFQREFS